MDREAQPTARMATKTAHAGSRTRVTSMGGLYDAATLHALMSTRAHDLIFAMARIMHQRCPQLLFQVFSQLAARGASACTLACRPLPILFGALGGKEIHMDTMGWAQSSELALASPASLGEASQAELLLITCFWAHCVGHGIYNRIPWYGRTVRQCF